MADERTPGDELAAAVLDTMAEPVYVVDRQRRILLWNHAAERLTGYQAEEVIGRRCQDRILNHVNDCGEGQCGSNCPLLRVMEGAGELETRFYLHHRNGHRQPVHVRATAIVDRQDHIIGATEVFHDDSETQTLRQKLTELASQALTDPLTGLGNRRYVEAELLAWLADRERYGYGFGLLIADIDHFKAINDTYGHTLGDQALQMVANSLTYAARAGDVIGRWGGEEFVVLARTPDPDGLARAAERLRVMVAASRLDSDAGPITATISMGAALATPGEAADALITRADGALYEAKANGRDRVVLA